MNRLVPLLILALAAGALPGSGLAQPAPDRTPSVRPPQSTLPPQGPTGAAVAPTGAAPAGDVMYVCPGGQDFTARFSDDGALATLLVPGQPDVELSRENSGSGFAYGDSYYELRGRGREATLAVRGSGTLRCHAAGRPGAQTRSFADRASGYTLTLQADGLFRLRERRADGSVQADHGNWSEEIEGGLRLVARGAAGRRSFREAGTGRLAAVEPPGPVLELLPDVDPIDERFELTGQFRIAPDGSVLTECQTGRLFHVPPNAAEERLEKAWMENTPAREATVFARVAGRFRPEGRLELDDFLGLVPGGSCQAPPTPSATLRGTEWRVVELAGERPAVESARQIPSLTLDDNGRFSGSAGCNRVSGSYTLDAAGLRFGPTATTRMACEGVAATVETRFLAALEQVTQARIAGTTLDLSDAKANRLMRLEARGR